MFADRDKYPWADRGYLYSLNPKKFHLVYLISTLKRLRSVLGVVSCYCCFGKTTILEIFTVRHHLAVLDENGIIISVNEAWRKFAEANGLPWDDYGVGRSYLKVCEFAEGDNAIEARAALKGIHGVMTNRQNEWSLEYACHSPAERRWFFMYVFRYEDKGNFRTAVIHMNITAQKLYEAKLQNSHNTLELRVKKRTADFVMTTGQLKREIR